MPTAAPSPTPVAVLAVALALVSGCASAAPDASRAANPAGPATARPDPGPGHVHGLGVDPADGALYAATHYGLFRLDGQRPAARVGDREQDTMGFTVVGPGSFLGSGHPDAQLDPDLAPRLGLVRSSDAGVSWQPVALSGAADFHALRAAGSTVYGWDSGSGQLRASDDGGVNWTTRSALALVDLAVDPARPAALLATTARGLLGSADGGRTWQEVPGAPRLMVLAQGAAALVVGVAPDGTVHVSADGGRTWQRRGATAGTPVAVALDDRTPALVYVAVENGIRVSRDGGVTFSALAGS